LKRRKKKKRKG